MKSIRMDLALGLGAPLVLIASPALAGAATESSKDIVAAHIRTQGFSCDKASSAVRDKVDSKPGEVVWLLTCEDASYRVRLVPDMAAQVERLPKDPPSDSGK